MSIELMTAVWKTNIGPATKRLVLLALADSANDEGSCFLLISTLARKANAGESSVQRVLAELEKDGLVRKEYRQNRSTIFHLDLTGIQGSRIETGSQIETPALSDRDPQGSQIETHNRPLEPKEEPKDTAAGAASKPVAYSEAFEAAWKAYGRKGAKRAAWLEWQRAIKRAPVDTIMAAIAPYLTSKPDPQYRKDFERWLKYDAWEGADAQPAGAPAPDAMTFEQADAWLRARWSEGAAPAVAARCGRTYRASPPPPALRGQALQEYRFADAQNWIRNNRQGLRAVLMGRPFQNGTEVQS